MSHIIIQWADYAQLHHSKQISTQTNVFSTVIYIYVPLYYRVEDQIFHLSTNKICTVRMQDRNVSIVTKKNVLFRNHTCQFIVMPLHPLHPSPPSPLLPLPCHDKVLYSSSICPFVWDSIISSSNEGYSPRVCLHGGSFEYRYKLYYLKLKHPSQ